MAEKPEEPVAGDAGSAERWLSQARELVPTALQRAREARGFGGRWRVITSMVERLPACLSDLSSHPCFAKIALCREQLQSVCATLGEVIELAGRHGGAADDPPRVVGKLQMQSDLDSLSSKLELNLRDCKLLVKTGVLGEFTLLPATELGTPAEPDVRELLARLHIGRAEAKHRAVEGLLEAATADDKTPVPRRSSLIREKTAAVICLLAESGSSGELLVSEGVIPADQDGGVGGRRPRLQREAVISLQRLSASTAAARSIVGYGGAAPLMEICGTAGNSVSQVVAAAGALKNLSAVSELRHDLARGGLIGAMLDLLRRGTVPHAKEYAAECLQHLTAGNDALRRAVAAEGGVGCLLAFLEAPSPPEPAAVGALRNLVGLVPPGSSSPCPAPAAGPRSAGWLPGGAAGRRRRPLRGLQLLPSDEEVRGGSRLHLPPGPHPDGAPPNARGLKKDPRSVPSLVRLLDPAPPNTAAKHAVACLLALSSASKRHSEMDVPGSKRLLHRLQRGKLPTLFRPHPPT
ncbi:unnamed protein product [Spirodela intermedia]|uniref:DUF7032 domain-containing protein n=1 Tax=Spirodela intermedia TaxID=51605 RepID=A0A7I8J068_SPIIN|nr:unnamed protein product [Spirodela intermedia]CAA6663362.1 unnamed protein product [Spirodela intermedia]